MKSFKQIQGKSFLERIWKRYGLNCVVSARARTCAHQKEMEILDTHLHHQISMREDTIVSEITD